MKEYMYGYRLRPPSIGTQPRGFLDWDSYPEKTDGYWGWVIYEEKLDIEVMEDYDLDYLGEED